MVDDLLNTPQNNRLSKEKKKKRHFLVAISLKMFNFAARMYLLTNIINCL